MSVSRVVDAVCWQLFLLRNMKQIGQRSSLNNPSEFSAVENRLGFDVEETLIERDI